MLKSSHSSLDICSRIQRWLTLRRHKGYTIVERLPAVPGACAPRSTATLSDNSGEHDFEEAMPNEMATPDESEDSFGEALHNKCDACRGPLYFVPLRGLSCFPTA